MANYNKKRVCIIVRTNDGREFKYVKPTITVNGTVVENYYEYDAADALTTTQAFTDFENLKAIYTASTEWIEFDIDITNETLNYYNSEEKGAAVSRPRKIVSVLKQAVSSIDIEEVALNDTY